MQITHILTDIFSKNSDIGSRILIFGIRGYGLCELTYLKSTICVKICTDFITLPIVN